MSPCMPILYNGFIYQYPGSNFTVTQLVGPLNNFVTWKLNTVFQNFDCFYFNYL